MTINITTTAEQDAAIRYYRRAHNAANGTSLTANQYADLMVLNMLNGIVASMKEERSRDELAKAFAAASPATQATVRTTLGIQEP